jgi:hypothetical protein
LFMLKQWPTNRVVIDKCTNTLYIQQVAYLFMIPKHCSHFTDIYFFQDSNNVPPNILVSGHWRAASCHEFSFSCNWYQYFTSIGKGNDRSCLFHTKIVSNSSYIRIKLVKLSAEIHRGASVEVTLVSTHSS